eukprot:TRINITY_DN790_c0_g2_i6.p1 TRINITY_DN790_c0_g2~~TRINITY_DN790_c0_g2_i6.p1  ORF type:complete len:218 (+),score=82.51 TRINITY_DN790_c0_g2_i6:33-686(+)
MRKKYCFLVIQGTKDVVSLCAQLKHCYGENKKKEHPCQLGMSGVGKEIRDVVLGIDRWKTFVTVREEKVEEVYEKSSLVYLTSEATEVMTEIDPEKVYVIGGMVDHNKHKGLSMGKAQRLGLETMQLPIGEYIQAMESRKVLTVNQVFEILWHFAECGDWEKAFHSVIPKRKLENKVRKRSKKRKLEEGQEEETGNEDDQEDDQDANVEETETTEKQ